MVFERMANRGHERVLFIQNRAAGLRAIIAIHSTTLGPALGGVRRWHYASEEDALEDVLRLSEAMTYKAAAAHLPMGGGKSVILLDAALAEPREVAAKAMGRAVDTLRGDYIAAEDVGVNEQYIDWMGEETRFVMGGEKKSRGGDPSPYTARGVVNGMRAAMRFLNQEPTFKDKLIAIQGMGHVGWNVARIVIGEGAKVKAADISPERLDTAKQQLGVEVVNVDHILATPCDILCPCALGGVINGNTIADVQAPILCGAANNVLDDPFEDSSALMARGVLYCPDFVVNAGGLIQLAGLWLQYTQAQLDQKIADIESTTLRILDRGRVLASNHAAAVDYARRVIDGGIPNQPRQGAIHAG
ncbi:MAG: leucine dehydrogenase [Phycisphaerales bacterium]|nr:leucine dehydrogenase [Phycisphaerales bacterium]